jgi:hypothetical protein
MSTKLLTLTAELELVKKAMEIIRNAPSKIELADRVKPLAESLLLGNITESEFRTALEEINFQKARTEAIDLAKSSMTIRLRELEFAVEEMEMKERQAVVLAEAEARRLAQPTAAERAIIFNQKMVGVL